MSDTPKTDAAVYLTRGPNFKAVCPNFARDLERECAVLKSELRESVKQHNANVKRDSQEIAALKLKIELLIRSGNGLAALLCSWCPKEERGKVLRAWDSALDSARYPIDAARAEKEEAELAALREDKERLDFGQIRIREMDELGDFYWCIHKGMNLRAAIDAARKEASK